VKNVGEKLLLESDLELSAPLLSLAQRTLLNLFPKLSASIIKQDKIFKKRFHKAESFAERGVEMDG